MDCINVIGVYKDKSQPLGVHASRVRAMGGDKCPVAWPKDGGVGVGSEKGSFAVQLKREGLNLLHEHAHILTIDGKKSASKMGAIDLCVERIQSGRMKMFASCHELKEEMNHYHHQDGKIPEKQEDHAIDAMLKGVMMLDRFGREENEDELREAATSSLTQYLDDYNFYS